MTTKVIDKVYENGTQVTNEYVVPEDQAWLYIMLDRQVDALKSMRTMLQFFVIILILGVIVQGCNLVLSSPLR